MRDKRYPVRVLGVLVCLLFSAAPLYAFEEGGPAGKLGRGVANLVTGWLELPAEITKTTERSGSLAGVTVGFARGVFFGIGRTVVGAFETLTFPFPTGAAGYGPLVRPEFVTFREADRW